MEVEDFIAYKCTEASIMFGGPGSEKNIGRNLTSIESRYGIAVNSGGGGDAELWDSTVYGELEDNLDCPPGSPCDHCLDSVGIVLNSACDEEHKDYEIKVIMLPLFKSCNSGMYGEMTYYNTRFIGFEDGIKSCGAHNTALAPWGSPDYTAYAMFKDSVFEDFNDEALTYIPDPD